MFLLLVLACSEPAPTPPEASVPDPQPAATAPADLQVHIDRAGRTLYLLAPDGAVTHSEPIGIGRGGLGAKSAMSDLKTPTGSFTVDLVLTRDGTHDAVAQAAIDRFAGNPAFAELLSGEPGLAGLFANMSRIDFDGDGTPDRAYGDAYVGLDAADAVTGPKMRRHSRSQTPYWYSIALHQTPSADNLGQANSGGCVHVADALLQRLIEEGTLALGKTVHIADGPPESSRQSTRR